MTSLRHRLSPRLAELGRGILSNAAWDILKKVLLSLGIGTVVSLVTSWLLRLISSTIPFVHNLASTTIGDVTITVGHVVILVLSAMAVCTVWLGFGRRRWVLARRRQQSVALFRAVYYDGSYATGWISHPEAVASYFAERGFEVLDARQLALWVDRRVERDEASRALVVFAQDMMPDTVADLRSPTCKLRLFLDAGGRVVWHGNAPFWHQARAGRRYDTWGADGEFLVLGVQTIRMEDYFGERVLSGMLTPEGRLWGIRLPGPAHRPVSRRQVDVAFTLGPPLKAGLPYAQVDTACCWHKIYNSHCPHSGFLRYWPSSRDGREETVNADYYRFAVSGWSAAATSEPFEAEAPPTDVILSDAWLGMFRPSADVDWTFAKLVERDWRWIQIPDAKWIWWKPQVTAEFQKGGTVEYKTVFHLAAQPRQAMLMFAVDDTIRNLRVNGTALGPALDVGGWDRVTIADLTPHVHAGGNSLEMTVVNATPVSPAGSSLDNPTGVCYRIDVVYAGGPQGDRPDED